MQITSVKSQPYFFTHHCSVSKATLGQATSSGPPAMIAPMGNKVVARSRLQFRNPTSIKSFGSSNNFGMFRPGADDGTSSGNIRLANTRLFSAVSDKPQHAHADSASFPLPTDGHSLHNKITNS